MLLLIFEKYWKYIVIGLLVVTCFGEYKYFNNKLEVSQASYSEAYQKSHDEYENKLNVLISQKTAIRQQLDEEIDKFNKTYVESIQRIAQEHDQKILDLNIEQEKTLENLKKEKKQAIKIRVDNSYNNPDETVNQIAKKFGFKVVINK